MTTLQTDIDSCSTGKAAACAQQPVARPGAQSSPDMLLAHPLRQFWALTKPNVTLMTVFCALIGMLLATSSNHDWGRMAIAASGIWLMAGGAFAMNCLLESAVDARMARTAERPTAAGTLGVPPVLGFATVIAALGAWLLYTFVNPLTMWLTLATFAGYAFFYTLYLKPRTPHNIVIGGFFGALPPLLGWAAITGGMSLYAWLLVLVIFLWTPPHFWALAMYRRQDYVRSGLPMLPVTHGLAHTGLQVWVYSVALAASTALPVVVGLAGWWYAIAAIALNAKFLRHAWLLRRRYTDRAARRAFGYSIVYLFALFAALLFDHIIMPV